MKAAQWLLGAACCAVAFAAAGEPAAGNAAPPPSAAPTGQQPSPGTPASGDDARGGGQPAGADAPCDQPRAANASGGTPTAGAPNDEFIEFLGADDVEDAAWWEFLKKSAPGKGQAPLPPQDSKQ